MVKVRLHGLIDEISELIDYLKSRPDVQVLCASAPYPDMGNSQYGRVYLDVEIKEQQ